MNHGPYFDRDHVRALDRDHDHGHDLDLVSVMSVSDDLDYFVFSASVTIALIDDFYYDYHEYLDYPVILNVIYFDFLICPTRKYV